MNSPTIRRIGALGGAAALALVFVASVQEASTLSVQGQGKGKGNGGGDGSDGGSPAAPNIAYIDQKGTEREIVLFDTSTGQASVLVPNANALVVAWSPDGTELAYRNAGGEIRIVATDSSGTDRFVVQTGGGNHGLDWSRSPAPNGRSMLVYGVPIAPGDGLIYAVAPDGTDLTLLAQGYIDPVWSPDANSLVAKATGSSMFSAPIEVLTIALGASGYLEVIDERPITMIPGSPVGPTLSHSDWSNDGRWVAVVAIDPSSFDGDLWLIDPFDPLVAVRLTVGRDWEQHPSFGALDQRIYFLGENITGSKDQLFSIDAAVGGSWVLESGSKQSYVSTPSARRDIP